MASNGPGREFPPDAPAPDLSGVLAPDILVVGAGMAGVMAALSAKNDRNRVLIVEPSNVLGGQGTAGGVAGFCGDTQAVNHVFDELVARLRQHKLIREFNPTEDRRSYDLEWCAFFLQEMVLERNIDVLLHSRVTGARAAEGVITEVDVSTVGGLCTLRPRFVIDATGACLIPAMAGFSVLHEGANKQLPMSLYFTLWDTGKPVRPFLPTSCDEWRRDAEIPMTTLHFFDSGKVEVKMKVVGFDAADGLSFSRAEMHARRQMISLIYYLQTKGFRGKKLDRHVLASVSRHIGVRETRRIVGEHFLTTDEVSQGTVFPDAVAVGTYHLDYHWPDTMLRGDTGITTMVEPYHIPLRAMVPKGARNLLVPGRGASGEQMAMSSFRVMAPVSQMGFAAGKAAQMCAEKNCGVDVLDIAELQRTIESGGQKLDLSRYGAYLRNSLVTHEPVFTAEQLFTECHAPALVHLRNNRFLTAWSVGTGIWAADRFQCRWSRPRRVAGIGPQRHWSPVLFRALDGTVHLYFRAGSDFTSAQLWWVSSSDDGQTWSQPSQISHSDVAVVGPAKARVLLPEDTLLTASRRNDGGIYIERGAKDGEKWSTVVCIGTIDASLEPRADEVDDIASIDPAQDHDVDALQPALWQSGAGRVHLVVADRHGIFFRSDSSDSGRTWTPLRRASVPRTSGGVDAAYLETAVLVVATHSAGAGQDEPSVLRLNLSFDNGGTWPNHLDIGAARDVSPAMVSTPRGVALVYVSAQDQLMFWHGSQEQIIERNVLEKHAESLHSGIMP